MVVNVDKNIVDKAMKKAKSEGVARNFKELINWLSVSQVLGELPNLYPPYSIKYVENKTTSLIVNDAFAVVQSEISQFGYTPTVDFTVRFLLINYLNK